MSRSKRGKARQRRQNHHQHHYKESEKGSSTSATPNGPACQGAGEGAKAVVTPRCSVEHSAAVTTPPTPNDSPKPVIRVSQSWLSRAVSISSAGAPLVSEADEHFESLLDGLTGPDLQTAKLIVQALRAPEDLSRLRRLAVTHGFVNDRIRAIVWPRLLGITPPGHLGLKLGQPPSLPPSSPAASRSRQSASSPLAATPPPPLSQQQHHPRHHAAPTSPSSGPSHRRPDGAQTALPTARQPPRRRRSSEHSPSRPGGAHGASSCAARSPPAGAESVYRGSDRAPGEAAERRRHSQEGRRSENGCLLDGTAGGSRGGCTGDENSPCAAAEVARTGPVVGEAAAGKADGHPREVGVARSDGAEAEASSGADEAASGAMRRASKGGRARNGGAAGPAAAAAAAAAPPQGRGWHECGAGVSGVGGGHDPCHRSAAPLRAAEEGRGGCGDGAAAAGNAAPAVPKADGGDAHRVARCANCGSALPSSTTAGGGTTLTIGISSSRTRTGVNGGGAEGPVHDAGRDRGPSREQDRGRAPSRDSQHPDADRDPDATEGGDLGDAGSWELELELEWQQYLRWAGQPHRDSGVVEVDVARSLWAFTRGLGEGQREARRGQLKRLLNAAVAAHQGDVFYYQGLHDVASVLLLSLPGSPPPPPAETPTAPPTCLHCGAPASAATAPQLIEAATRDATPGASVPQSPPPSPPAAVAVAVSPVSPAAAARPAAAVAAAGDSASAIRGELLAFALLRRLATTHLRDATRSSLEPVVQLLGLMPALVSAADPPLGRHLSALGLQPFFALSWLITWWAHELDELAPAARLYDFFLAGHPLMPLYVGAVAMRSQRTALLRCEEMPELHSALTNLKLVAAGPGGCGGGERWSGRGGGGGGGRESGSSIGGGGRQEGGMVMQLEELLRQAERLWRAKPPQALVPPPRLTRGSLPSAAAHGLRQRRGGGWRRGGVREEEGYGDEGAALVRLTACVAHAARMEGRPALWTVPDAAPAGWPVGWAPGAEVEAAGDGSGGLGRVLSRANSALGGGRSRTVLLGTALLAGMYVAAAVAIGYATFSRATAGQP